jgi:colanic acid/amylovoran biosynthesis glycosyltransferase
VRIAYFINQYPAISHTFIRREIRALEGLGVTVVRYALRPSPGMLVDIEDDIEIERTKYIQNCGAAKLLFVCLIASLSQPRAIFRMIKSAMKLGWRSDRGMLRHFVYSVEATVLADWCRRDGIEHVHAHFGTNSAAIAMLAQCLSGITYSFTVHGPEEFEKASLLSLDKKLSHAAFAVCVSSYGKSQLMYWTRPEYWEKIAVVHCGLDRSFLNFSTQEPSIAPRFVCVGRLSEQKGQLVLVAAARRLHEQGHDFEVVLVGDGHMRGELENAIRGARLERHITITGSVSGERVRAEISSARAVVLPSFAEGLPVVLMEAMALSRPVIATYIAGIPELVQDGRNGWLVPAGDEVALAEAMREALTAPVDKLMRMGAAGRVLVLQRHDVVAEATKLKCLFEGNSATSWTGSLL